MNSIDDVLLPASLWCIMLSMGLSLTVADFKRVFVQRRALIVGTVSILVFPPIVGVTVATLFAPTSALAVGFVLLATCPGGMLSNVMTDIAKGDLALSMSLTILVSLIYILLVPFYAYGALAYFMHSAQLIRVPFGEFILHILGITVLPAAIGILLRARWSAWAIAAKGWIKIVAMVVLLYAFGVIMVGQIGVLRDNFGRVFWMVLALNLIVPGGAFVLSKLSGLQLPQRKAVCVEHVIRQEGTAIFIAVTILGSREMSLPMIMNTPIGLVVCIAMVMLMRRSAARASPASDPVKQNALAD